MNYTNEQLAKCFDLWQEYIDPLGVVSFDEFLNLSASDRIALITQTFPTSDNANL